MEPDTRKRGQSTEQNNILCGSATVLRHRLRALPGGDTACHYPDYHLMTRTVSGPRTEPAADRERHPEMGLLMLSRMWETKGQVTDGEHTEKLLLQNTL